MQGLTGSLAFVAYCTSLTLWKYITRGFGFNPLAHETLGAWMLEGPETLVGPRFQLN